MRCDPLQCSGHIPDQDPTLHAVWGSLGNHFTENPIQLSPDTNKLRNGAIYPSSGEVAGSLGCCRVSTQPAVSPLFFFLCCSQLTSAIPAGRTAGEFFIGPRPQPRRDLQRRHGSICGAVPLFGFRVISRKTKMEGDKKQTSIFQRKLEDTSRLFLQARIHTFTSEPK